MESSHCPLSCAVLLPLIPRSNALPSPTIITVPTPKPSWRSICLSPRNFKEFSLEFYHGSDCNNSDAGFDSPKIAVFVDFETCVIHVSLHFPLPLPSLLPLPLSLSLDTLLLFSLTLYSFTTASAAIPQTVIKI